MTFRGRFRNFKREGSSSNFLEKGGGGGGNHLFGEICIRISQKKGGADPLDPGSAPDIGVQVATSLGPPNVISTLWTVLRIHKSYA